jgi:hypothetical protein
MLWALAVVQMEVSVPRTVHAAQWFGMKLPWFTEVVRGTPVWAVAALGATAALMGVLAQRRAVRAGVLVALPLVVNLAIHLSVYSAQSKLVWGLMH